MTIVRPFDRVWRVEKYRKHNGVERLRFLDFGGFKAACARNDGMGWGSDGFGRSEMMGKARYRKLHRYKYQLMEPYSHPVELEGHIDTPYVKLEAGRL